MLFVWKMEWMCMPDKIFQFVLGCLCGLLVTPLGFVVAQTDNNEVEVNAVDARGL